MLHHRKMLRQLAEKDGRALLCPALPISPMLRQLALEHQNAVQFSQKATSFLEVSSIMIRSFKALQTHGHKKTPV